MLFVEVFDGRCISLLSNGGSGNEIFNGSPMGKKRSSFLFFFTSLPSSWLAHLVLGSIFDCLRRRVYKRGFFKSMGLGEIEESISQCKRVKRCDVGENPVFDVMCIHELWAE